MKKILLATTILAMSAGYASAQIVWGGSASAGIASNGTADGGMAQVDVEDTGGPAVHGDDVFETYSSFNLAVTASGASDSGLTFGATFDLTAGTAYTLGDEDGFVDESGAFGMPTVFVEGSFGKLAIADDDYDFYDDTNAGGDVEYTGTFGAVSVGVIVDVDKNTALTAGDPGFDKSNMSAKVGYSTGPLALSANLDTYELWNVEGTYTMGSIAVTAATDESENSSLKAAFTGGNGFTASAQFNTNGGTAGAEESIDVAAGYSANGLSVNLSADNVGSADTDGEGDADEVVQWEVTGSYDLGGGLSVEAGTNYTEDMMLGAKMTF